MPTPVSMCLFNPKPKQSQRVNRLRAPQRAPQRAHHLHDAHQPHRSGAPR